jgi:hypothetical protein
MIYYVIGSAFDLKQEMKQRELANYADFRLIRTPDDLNGVSIRRGDNVIWGFHAPSGYDRQEMQTAVEIAQLKGGDY